MVHLSLKKRAMIVRDKFQLQTFDAMTLRRYYIKFKVKFIRPNYTYWKSFAEKNSLKREAAGVRGAAGKCHPRQVLRRDHLHWRDHLPFMAEAESVLGDFRDETFSHKDSRAIYNRNWRNQLRERPRALRGLCWEQQLQPLHEFHASREEQVPRSESGGSSWQPEDPSLEEVERDLHQWLQGVFPTNI